MARTVRNAKIDTRSGRLNLAERREPHWTVIGRGAALGYRKGAKGGTWIARLRDESGKQHYEAVGAADDHRDANGADVLSFAQAQERARAWFERKRRELAADGEDDEPAADGTATVADAMRAYLDWCQRHSKPSGYAFAKSSVATHIVPYLGAIPVARLSAGRIRRWHEALAAAPAMLRTATGATTLNTRNADDDPEAPRKRKATANRVLTILKAALNKAFHDGKAASNEAWTRVKPFRDVDAARVRYLSDDESRRLVNACDPAFRPMVQAALLSGCRYGELAALRVDDFDADAGTLRIRQSKSGKPRHVVLTDEGRDFFGVQAAGRRKDTSLLPRPDGKPWGRSHQLRPVAEACKRGAIVPAASFHVLRHTYASRLAMKGVPLLVIAQQLGHGDTRMVEKHYGHLSKGYVAETVRAAFGTLGIAEKGTVVPLKAKA